jgi:hypothetical protein
MVIAHFLSTTSVAYRDARSSFTEHLLVWFYAKSSISSLVHHSHSWNQLGPKKLRYSWGFLLSIGELWMCSSRGPTSLYSSSLLQKGLLPCRIRNHSAVLQNTESRSFHENFSIRGSPRSKLGSVTKTPLHDEASSSTATLRTITCSDSSQHIRRQHGNNLVRDSPITVPTKPSQ